jgi:hypothetical protein
MLMGQAKKNQRQCPAVSRVINAVECASHRGNQYRCPADCHHNPWAPVNYTRALEIEDDLNKKMMRRLKQEQPDIFWEPDQVTVDGMWKSHNYFLNQFQFRRDTSGQTFLERWQQRGFEGLNNDKQLFLACKTQSRLGLIEVHRVLNLEQVEVVDLLDPDAGTWIVVDRHCAAIAVRFAHLLAWYYEMPHYRRLNGLALTLPVVSNFDGLEVLHEIVQHLGGPVAPGPLRAWLAENHVRIEEAFHAVGTAQHEQLLRSIDMRFSRATYRLRCRANDLLRRLGKLPVVDVDDMTDKETAERFQSALVWFDEPAPAEPGQMPLDLPPHFLLSGGTSRAGARAHCR